MPKLLRYGLTIIRFLPLLILAACAMAPLPSYLMQPDRKIYQQTDGEAHLARNIFVQSVTYQGHDKMIAPAFDAAQLALSDALAIGNYTTSEKDAKYTLSAAIRDVQFPRCFMGSCDTGSAIDYTLTNVKTEKVVYNDLLVVPHTSHYSIFVSDPTQVQQQALGGAIGENYAHLIQVLHNMKESDLKE